MIVEETKQFEMLIQSLQLLAADYDVQVESLPNFVHVPDEVALIFDDCFKSYAVKLLVTGVIDKVINEKLEKVNNLLDSMSDCKGIWTLESLKTAKEWEEIREMSREILELLKIRRQKPDLFWIKYLKDKK